MVVFGICVILFVDGIILSFDYDNSGILKRLRELIDNEKQYRASEYEKQSIKISVATQM